MTAQPRPTPTGAASGSSTGKRSGRKGPRPYIRPVSGVVEQIAISAVKSRLPEPVDSVELVADQGPRGDRYFAEEPDPARRDEGYDVTLIEAEALEAFAAET